METGMSPYDCEYAITVFSFKCSYIHGGCFFVKAASMKKKKRYGCSSSLHSKEIVRECLLCSNMNKLEGIFCSIKY